VTDPADDVTDLRQRSQQAGFWTPRPDPTVLTTEAVTRVTEQFGREIAGLRELHDKDMAAAAGLLDARLAGMDTDRGRLWDRTDDIIKRFTAALNDFRDEVERRDKTGRDLLGQRLDAIDRATELLAVQAARNLAVAEQDDDRCRRDMLARSADLQALIEQRLDSMDEAAKVLASSIEKYPSDLDRAVNAMRDVILGQLEITATRLDLSVSAIDGQFAASKTAVDAALSAAKEAVAEQNKANTAAIKVSEGNTKEQLTSLGQVSSANFKALEDKIADARDRLTAMEALTRGIDKASIDQRGASGLRVTGIQASIMAVSLLLSAIAIIVTLVLHK